MWTLQDAKNPFSAVVDVATCGEPQKVTRHGKWVSVVLSELRLHQRDSGVVAWIASQRQEDCFLSVVSIGEIERGSAHKRLRDSAFATQLAG